MAAEINNCKEEKMNILKMTVNKKYAWCLRLIFLLAAFYFLQDIYYSFSSGTVIRRSEIIELSKNPSSFYSVIFKKSAFALVFLLFTFFGVKSKSQDGKTNDSNNKTAK
jgi:hypothetical protein